EAFLMQAHAIAQRIVSADRHQIINTQPLEIFQNFRREIVLFLIELRAQMFRHVALAGFAGIGARRMQKGAAGAACAVHRVFGQQLIVVRIVVIFVAHYVDQATPTVPEANDLIAFAQRAIGNAANCGVEAGNVTAPGQDSDDALLGADTSHICATVWIRLNAQFYTEKPADETEQQVSVIQPLQPWIAEISTPGRNRRGALVKLQRKWSAVVVVALLAIAASLEPAFAWNDRGHMSVGYVAYLRLKPATRDRVNALLKLNPNYNDWEAKVSKQIPNATADDKNMMIFMLATTWADEIKRDRSYKQDGTQSGNRPEGSPDPGRNTGYDDLLMHKYWHFIDTPFSRDGTTLPPIPTPNAQERIALFRTVLASSSPDQLKSYDLVWLLHIVGDIHQPLHASTRVSKADPDGDAGGNLV